MASVVCYGALLLVFLPPCSTVGVRTRRRARRLFLAIGLAAALGVHYVSDVLGGYVLGERGSAVRRRVRDLA